MAKKLYKSATDKKIDGVCAGLGDYFDVDANVIRVGFVLATLLSGIFPGILAYIVLAVVIPREGEKKNG